ncbi:hypothetical protein [Bacillus sp. MUM 13]|uniref:hypothetical protein n=1 Tax=Bacillus sp. MUM 13 TaxID=1678001 RepID=UPI00147E7978|nr:hypothetical protein [Bacillus sp. MUM 13]
MKQYEINKNRQLELFERTPVTQKHAKRVTLVSIKVVREKSFLYPRRNVSSPGDAYC